MKTHLWKINSEELNKTNTKDIDKEKNGKLSFQKFINIQILEDFILVFQKYINI